MIHKENKIPCFSILALPIGMRKSFDIASADISKATPYNSSFSKKTTKIKIRSYCEMKLKYF